jgi:hypothetical protein
MLPENAAAGFILQPLAYSPEMLEAMLKLTVTPESPPPRATPTVLSVQGASNADVSWYYHLPIHVRLYRMRIREP